jgi:hypothetical protein
MVLLAAFEALQTALARTERAFEVGGGLAETETQDAERTLLAFATGLRRSWARKGSAEDPLDDDTTWLSSDAPRS